MCGKFASQSLSTSAGLLLIQLRAQTVGGILTGCLAVAVGIIGAKHHIGFTVSCRFSWGLRGSYCRLGTQQSQAILSPGSSRR